jgi:trehalose 6-phosphate phosphatase
VLAAWQARPHEAHPLLLMDFDGTLAEFALDPAEVALPESRQLLLQSLAKRADISAGIISGRRIADLRERVPAASALFFAGLHGGIEGPELASRIRRRAAAPAISILAKELRRA